MSVHLHGATIRRSFPSGGGEGGYCVLRLEPMDPWVVFTRERREDKEARERIATEQADEGMAELRCCRYPEQVHMECQLYEQYTAGAAEVIHLCIDSDGDGGNDGQRPATMIGGLRADWKRLEEETDRE